MGVFVRAVITGFGLSVGKALYDKVSERLLGESKRGSDDEQPPPIDDHAEPIASPN